jgi:glutathione peroxidase
VAWNFEKFLIGKQGNIVARFPSRVAPDDAELIAAIEGALAA